jgi:hypothetical protein
LGHRAVLLLRLGKLLLGTEGLVALYPKKNQSAILGFLQNSIIQPTGHLILLSMLCRKVAAFQMDSLQGLEKDSIVALTARETENSINTAKSSASNRKKESKTRFSK